MTYTSGSIISAADINTYITGINLLLGPGTGNIGLGQSDLTPAVTTGNVIQAGDFISLCNNITKLHYHQHDNLSDGPVPPVVNRLNVNTTQNSNTVATNSNVDNLPYGAFVYGNNHSLAYNTQVVGKRVNGRTNLIDLSAPSAITGNVSLSWSNHNLISVINQIPAMLATVQSDYGITSEYGTDVTQVMQSQTSWSVKATREFSVSFGTADQARYFFNAGGHIIFNFAGSNLAGNQKSQEWNNIIDNGIVDLAIRKNSFTRGGSDFNLASLVSDYGYYRLTTTYSTVFKLYNNSAQYGMNYIQAELKTNQVNAGGLQDNGNQVYIKVSLFDDAGDADQVQGLLKMNIIVRPAWNGYLTNTWGQPVITVIDNSQT
jgi:hypothetical protein